MSPKIASSYVKHSTDEFSFILIIIVLRAKVCFIGQRSVIVYFDRAAAPVYMYIILVSPMSPSCVDETRTLVT